MRRRHCFVLVMDTLKWSQHDVGVSEGAKACQAYEELPKH